LREGCLLRTSLWLLLVIDAHVRHPAERRQPSRSKLTPDALFVDVLGRSRTKCKCQRRVWLMHAAMQTVVVNAIDVLIEQTWISPSVKEVVSLSRVWSVSDGGLEDCGASKRKSESWHRLLRG